MTVGKKLQELMDWSGKQQVALAKETGISQSMISEYVRDVREPPLPQLRKIAAALDVTLWALLNGAPMVVKSIDLTEAEQQMVSEYRTLTREEREMVDSMLRTLNGKKSKNG